MIETRFGDWLQTYSGGRIYPLDPRPEEIHIEDIAHALSLLCRFGGHCTEFYSVAQHSVVVSRIVPPPLALQGLLHDASEAYIVDVPRPIKRDEGMSFYRFAERQLQAAIYRRFGLSEEDHADIKLADNRALAQEHRDLMATCPHDWPSLDGLEPLPFVLSAWSPAIAERVFLETFRELTFKAVKS